jgi:Tfp pilus assembly protein PilO
VPALPLDEAGSYVAAAYIVFVVLLLIYVGIMAARLGTLSKEIESLAELAERERDKRNSPGPSDEVAEGSNERVGT